MSGIVYLLRAGEDGPVKIGYTTKDVLFRVKQLQTGCPSKIKIVRTILGNTNIEKHLHSKFSGHRLQGEWFVANPDIEEAFNFAAMLPPELNTLPPVTEAGRALIKLNGWVSGLRKKYPDGATHSKIDWDCLANEVEEDLDLLDEYLAKAAA